MNSKRVSDKYPKRDGMLWVNPYESSQQAETGADEGVRAINPVGRGGVPQRTLHMPHSTSARVPGEEELEYILVDGGLLTAVNPKSPTDPSGLSGDRVCCENWKTHPWSSHREVPRHTWFDMFLST